MPRDTRTGPDAVPAVLERPGSRRRPGEGPRSRCGRGLCTVFIRPATPIYHRCAPFYPPLCTVWSIPVYRVVHPCTQFYQPLHKVLSTPVHHFIHPAAPLPTSRPRRGPYSGPDQRPGQGRWGSMPFYPPSRPLFTLAHPAFSRPGRRSGQGRWGGADILRGRSSDPAPPAPPHATRPLTPQHQLPPPPSPHCVLSPPSTARSSSFETLMVL